MCSRPNRSYFLGIGRRLGYTLVEILVATTLTLILMTAVVTVFGGVGSGISKARKTVEMVDRLRTVAQVLNLDLHGVTVKMLPPARQEEAPGYFELIEGGGTGNAMNPPAKQDDGTPDSTVGECGDVLMFTTRSAARPFVGLYAGSPSGTTQSDVAEVAWFLRGHNLHRRVLLVAPSIGPQGFSQTWYQNNDISVRKVSDTDLIPNSLADLTKRENRFGHPRDKFPFDARQWGQLRLPTLVETAAIFQNAIALPAAPPTNRQVDLWSSQPSDTTWIPDTYLVNNSRYTPPNPAPDRLADDLVLTNVIAFDVKVWEPALNQPNNNASGFVDLGYARSQFVPAQNPPKNSSVQRFQHVGAPLSYLTAGGAYSQCVYDTGCFSYENEGIYDLKRGYVPDKAPGPAGRSTNGLDDGSGVVDGNSEQIYTPPYPVPLRGIQVKIRVFEPDSREVREVTVEQDFLPK